MGTRVFQSPACIGGKAARPVGRSCLRKNEELSSPSLFGRSRVRRKPVFRVLAAVFFVGEQRFKSKAAATEHARSLLNGHAIGARVSAAGDHRFLADLLQLHPHASEKIGAGIAFFSVTSQDRKTRCFIVHRVDGSSTDFSFPNLRLKTCAFVR